MSVYGNDAFGNRPTQPGIDMTKNPLDPALDLDKIGTAYPVLTGTKRLYVTWRAEGGGFMRGGAIDLNAFAAVFDTDKSVVAACHDDDKRAIGGALVYGGNTKAKKGKSAKEYVRVNFDSLLGREECDDLVFGATCLTNPLALSKVAELQVLITEDSDDVDIDAEDQTTASGIVIPGRLRSIEGSPTAALFYRVHLGKGDSQAYLRRVKDSTTVTPVRGADYKQTWRSILGDLRGAVQRPMFEAAA